MAGSQALEVAVGLVLMLFLLSLIASSAVEVVSQILRKRSSDLHKVMARMVGTQTDPSVPTVAGTATYAMLQVGSTRPPSYLPARAFGDAVLEIVATARKGAADAKAMFDRLPTGLQAKLRPLLMNAQGDLTAVRAEAETWFDQTMDRLAGVYKRWTQLWLFCAGLTLAVAANASVFGVASKLWHDPVTRAAVAEAASQLSSAGGSTDPAADLEQVASQVDDLEAVGLPLGWDGDHPAGKGLGLVGTAAGWLSTALLVMLGAPFWFDTLTRLVSIRSSGQKPPRAPDDPASATSVMRAAGGPAAIGRDGAVAFGAPVGGAVTPEDRLFQNLPA